MSAVLRQAPNILSGLRLVAAPVAAWLILNAYDMAALMVFVFAGLSDAADGYLAKRFGLASRFGAILDPAADKLLMLASFLSLAAVGAVPVWLTALVIGRDLAIVAGVALARLLSIPLEVRPLYVGKASTVIQVVYIALVLLLLTLHEPPPMAEKIGEVSVTVLAVWSFLAYALVWLKAALAPQGDGAV
ncbi:CDP-alcohol phosphatidyltransferase family protein [Rhizomicrobium palustre]